MLKARKHPGIGNIDSTSGKPLPHFEQLEPRILLSGDGLLNVMGPVLDQNTLMESVPEVVQYSELSQTHEQVEEPAQCEPSNADDYQPILTLFVDDNANEESAQADLGVSNIDSAQVNCDIAVLSDDSDGDIESLGTTEDCSPLIYVNDVHISIEENTSIEIRGPPTVENSMENTINSCLESEKHEINTTIILDDYALEVLPDGTIGLPGMKLVDPSVNRFDDQIVYLDFDGEDNVTYDGPVTVEGIDVPEFVAPGDLAGQEQAIITDVLEALNEFFADSGVVFTTKKPDHK